MSSHSSRWITLVGFLVTALAAGAVGGLATSSSVDSWYATLDKPAWTPPSAVFGPVWTGLYILMAIVGWRLWLRREDPDTAPAVPAWSLQWVLNAAWSPLFFGFRQPLLGLIDIVALGAVLVWLQVRLFRVDRIGAWLWLPYVLWVGYAATLNAAIWWMN